jgi:hypothetical protein
MTDTRRAAAGFLLAPPIVGIVIACIVFVLAAIGEPGDFGRASLASLLALAYAALAGWAFALVFGVPAYLLLKRLRIVSPWPTIIVAALIGAAFPWLAHWLLLDPSASVSVNGCQTVAHGLTTACGYRHLAFDTIFPVLIGAVAGLVFWLIYAGGWRLRGRRDSRL